MFTPESPEKSLENSLLENPLNVPPSLLKPKSEYRLPVDHPNYRYPSSINPYWAKLRELKGLVFSDNGTEEKAGNWRSQVETIPNLQNHNNTTPELHVEIGCNAGHVIVEWAKKNPQNAYIGIDWKFKPIFRGAEKAQKRNLKNLLFFRAHAERIDSMFGPNEIDYLYLYFPDPWQKNSQLKNRFLTRDRLQKILKIMKPNGIFHIKTDHPGYFEWILDAVSQSSDTWTILEMSKNLYENHPAPETLKIPDVTLFERLFIQDKLPIHSIKIQPNRASKAP